MRRLHRLRESVVAVLGLTLLATGTTLLAGIATPGWAVGPLLLALAVGVIWVSARRPGPAMAALTLVGLLSALTSFVALDRTSLPLVLVVAAAVLAGLVDDPLRQRLAPGLRAVQLPGVRSDPRPEQPGPFSLVAQFTVAALAVLLVVSEVVALPPWVAGLTLVALVAGLAHAALRLREIVRATRRGEADAAVTRALETYAPQFFLYFSGPADGEYQLRMWLPHLERLGVPYAVLSREPKLLPRAEGLTSAPVVLCERLAAMDAVMVPSVRALFYVNTHHQCADPVRYLDRTHVHLNHGDSDKPSSYHPMIAMFDQVFVAGQAAIDRFARHGVTVPAEKFVLVGRPQVGDIVQHNVSPLPERPTVLYAPTWRGGLREMSFSSLSQGEVLVRALLERGVRVAFRPHPFSLRDKASTQAMTQIDALLAAATTPETPHLTSRQTSGSTITEAFNSSDALVTDVSSVASDYLQSGKPFAVVDMAALGGQRADPEAFPVLSGAYLLDGTEPGTGLDDMLTRDSLAPVRTGLRTAYLGDHPDPAARFLDCAVAAVHGVPGPASE